MGGPSDERAANPVPTIGTERLQLGPFVPADATDVQALAGDARVASTTLNVPHPYENGMAETWIAGHAPAWRERKGAALAIRDHGGERLVGCVGLTIVTEHRRGTLGYWIGPPFWGRGICSEAVAAVLTFAFDTLDLRRVEAHHLVRNPASGAVMRRVGMQREGVFRDYVWKDGRFEDIAQYAILADDVRGTDVTPGPCPLRVVSP